MQNKEFVVGGIIRITEFIKNEVKGKPIIIVLNFETLSKEQPLVGNPQPYAEPTRYGFWLAAPDLGSRPAPRPAP